MARTGRRTTYACQVCGKAYLVRTDRDEHLRAQHPQHPEAQLVPKQKCRECGREFSGKSNLLRHEKAAHNGGRIFNCPHCKGTEPSSVGNRKGNIADRHCIKCQHRPQHLPNGKCKADEPQECASQAELEAKQREFRAQTTPEQQQPGLDAANLLVDTTIPPLVEDSNSSSPGSTAFQPWAIDPMLTGPALATDTHFNTTAQMQPDDVNNFDPYIMARHLRQQMISETSSMQWYDQEARFMELVLQQCHPAVQDSVLEANAWLEKNDSWI